MRSYFQQLSFGALKLLLSALLSGFHTPRFDEIRLWRAYLVTNNGVFRAKACFRVIQRPNLYSSRYF